MERESKSRVSLFKVPWVDVLFCHIFSHLGPQDLFNLRAASRESKAAVTEYFKVNRSLDFSAVSRHVTLRAFQTATRDATKLRRIDLSNCKWLDSKALGGVLDCNPNLQQLRIGGCISVSNGSLQVLATHAAELRVLDLSNCHWTSAGAVMSVALNCPCLEFVDLTSCWEVTDEAVCELVLNCPRLKSLSVSRIYGITDKSLVVVAHKSHLLENLNLTGCWRITDYGVRLVGEYCRQLKSLRVEDCRSVTEFSLKSLRARMHVDRACNGMVFLPRVQLQI